MLAYLPSRAALWKARPPALRHCCSIYNPFIHLQVVCKPMKIIVEVCMRRITSRLLSRVKSNTMSRHHRSRRASIMLRNMRTSIAAAVTLFLLAMGLPNAATALGHERPQQAPGTLDTTFGTGGIVTNALAQSAIAQGVVQPSDGKLVVAGFAVTAEAASVFSEVA